MAMTQQELIDLHGRLFAVEVMIEMLWTDRLSAPDDPVDSEKPAGREEMEEERIQRHYRNFQQRVEYAYQQRSLPADELESEGSEAFERAMESFLRNIEARLKSL